MLSRPYKWFLGLCAVALVGWIALVLTTGHVDYANPISEDLFRLNVLAGVVRSADEVPLATDGRMDLFALFVPRHKEDHLWCYSMRRKMGPSAAEVEARDYRNFPWERAVGPIDPKGPVRPLLWEPEPNPDGLRLVAFTDGSAKALEEAAFQKLAVR